MSIKAAALALGIVALSALHAGAQGRIAIPDEAIKSVQTYVNSDITTFPVILLGSADTVKFTFDDLDGKAPRSLMYKLLHCDERWRDEALFASDYLDGFNEQYLYNNGFSSNTAIRYVHYDIRFPNENVKPKVSGNYQLVVYDANTQDELLRVGFMIAESSASVVATLLRPNDSNYRSAHQLNIKASYSSVPVSNPTTEIKTRVYQNYRLLPDNMQPKAVTFAQNSVDYNRQDLNIYPAGNEFRALDIRDPHYLSTNATSVRQLNGQYYIMLQPDMPRDALPYSYSIDYNGKFVISGINRLTPETTCEYYSVLFMLKMPYLGSRYDLFLEGELTGWEPTNSGKMLYNHQTGCYEAPFTLKQGYYNYRYVVRDSKGVEQLDLSPEGSFSQTQNSYQVAVYYKGVRDIFTRLIGTTSIDEKRSITR